MTFSYYVLATLAVGPCVQDRIAAFARLTLQSLLLAPDQREKDHCSGYTTGATELGSCLTDVTREGSLPKSRSCGYRYVVARTSHTTIIAAF